MSLFISIKEIAKLASRSSSQGGERGTQRRFERIDSTPLHIFAPHYSAHEDAARGADIAHAASPVGAQCFELACARRADHVRRSVRRPARIPGTRRADARLSLDDADAAYGGKRHGRRG